MLCPEVLLRSGTNSEKVDGCKHRANGDGLT